MSKCKTKEDRAFQVQAPQVSSIKSVFKTYFVFHVCMYIYIIAAANSYFHHEFICRLFSWIIDYKMFKKLWKNCFHNFSEPIYSIFSIQFTILFPTNSPKPTDF